MGQFAKLSRLKSIFGNILFCFWLITRYCWIEGLKKFNSVTFFKWKNRFDKGPFLNCLIFSLCMNCIVRAAHVPPTMSGFPPTLEPLSEPSIMSVEPRLVCLGRVWLGLVRLRQVWLGMWLLTNALNLKNANEWYQICLVLKNFFFTFWEMGLSQNEAIVSKIQMYKIGTWHFLKLHDPNYQYQK